MRYKKAKPGDALSFPAGLQNDLIDLLASREAGNGFSAGLLGRFAQGVIVNVKNTSGADRARWENMALSNALRFTLGTDGKESVIFNAIAGDPAKPPAILQEPIANNKYGRALIFGYTLARVAAGSTTLEAAKPNASHKLTPDAGGTVRLLAAPSVSAETVIPVVVGFGATGGTGLAKSPAGGIPARSGIIPGVATCNLAELYDDAGTIKIREKSPAEPFPIFNTTSVVVSGSKWIHWKTDGGRKTIDVDDCP